MIYLNIIPVLIGMTIVYYNINEIIDNGLSWSPVRHIAIGLVLCGAAIVGTMYANGVI